MQERMAKKYQVRWAIWHVSWERVVGMLADLIDSLEKEKRQFTRSIREERKLREQERKLREQERMQHEQERMQHKQEVIETATTLLGMGDSVEKVALATKLPLETVETLRMGLVQ